MTAARPFVEANEKVRILLALSFFELEFFPSLTTSPRGALTKFIFALGGSELS